MSFKSGFIGIIGRPNAGKSTLLNALVQEKIAIATYKPQTTRNVIRGIKTTAEYQLVFVDTPGIHKAKHELGKEMNKQAFSTMHGVDLIYYIVDATKPINKGDQYIIQALKQSEVPVFLVVNKLDKLNESQKLDALSAWNAQMEFEQVLPISALKTKNLDLLIDTTLPYLHDSAQYYPEGQTSDYPEQFMIGEIIREKVLFCLDQEVPHSIAVVVESVHNKNDTMIVHAVICVERDSQKGIVIGRNGSMLKKISTEAREELAFRFGCKVFLEIFVRIEEDWRDKPRQLQALGYLDKEES